MAILKALSTDTVEQAFINKYNPTVDEIITSISRAGQIVTYTKEGGGSLFVQLLPAANEVVEGGVVSVGVNNLTFDVTSASYVIENEEYHYAGGSVTLTDGDVTNDRIDSIVLDDSNNLVLITGTAAATPAPPAIASNQLVLASFIVKAGATTATSGDVFVNLEFKPSQVGEFVLSSNLNKAIESEDGGISLNGLSDVVITSPTTGQVIRFDGAGWVNVFLSINDLSDVDLTGLSDADVLVYNNANSRFEPIDFSFSNLNDVALTAPVDGQFLTFAGGSLINTNTLQAAFFSGKIIVNGVISPPALTASQNNYNPSGLLTANVLRLSATSQQDITGIAAQESGRVVYIFNVGSSNIRLINNSVSSLAVNRFSMGNNTTISPEKSVAIYYDGASSRWRIINL